MLKTSLRIALSSSVLISGLISCAQEKKQTKDVYNPPAPKVLQGDRRESLNGWNQPLALQAEIDLSEGQPAHTIIDGSCQGGGKSGFSHDFGNRLKIGVFEILKDYLTQDLKRNPLNCSLQIRTRNSNGSTHIFPMLSQAIVDSGAAQIRLDAGPNKEPQAKSFSELFTSKIRYENRQKVAAQLICQDFQLAPLEFEKVLNVDQFDFTKGDLGSEKMRNKGEQLCRFIMTGDGHIVATSELLRLAIPALSLKVTVLPQLTTTSKALQELIQNRSPIFASFQIDNPESRERRLRLVKSGAQAKLLINIGGNGNTASHDEISTVSWKLEPSLPVAQDRPDSSIFILPPNSSLNLNLRANGTVTCGDRIAWDAPSNGMGEYIDSLTMSQTAPLRLDEVDAQDNIVQTFALMSEQPTYFYRGNDRELLSRQDQFRKLNPICSWRR